MYIYIYIYIYIYYIYIHATRPQRKKQLQCWLYRLKIKWFTRTICIILSLSDGWFAWFSLIHPVSLYDFLALLALHSNRTSQELLPEPCIMVLIHLLWNQHSDVFWTIWFLPVKVNHGKSMVKPKTPRCAIFCRTISSSDRQDTPERTEVPVFVAATRFPTGNRGGLGPVSLIEGRCPQGHEPNREKTWLPLGRSIPKI